jgi:cytosine/creatinine deaminase
MSNLPRRRFFRQLISMGVTGTAGAAMLRADALQPTAPGESTVISQVRLRGRAGLWNVGLRGDRIERITQGPLSAANTISGSGRLLTEGLVEHHIHLDKAFTADRVRWDEKALAAERTEYDVARKVKFIRGFSAWRESQIKHTFTERDVFERALRLARMESANGTTTIRTHAVVEAVRGLNCVRGLLEARAAMKPYMDLQINLHPQEGNLIDEPHIIDLIHQSMKLGCDGVGGVPEVVRERADEYIDLVFKLAAEHGGFVDMHLDQAPDSPFMHPIVVAKTRKYGLQNQVTASHSFALGFQPREKILPVLDEMREVGIHLACVPNRSLEERVRIPRSKGVLVSLANDNVRDIWTRGGRADLVESGALYYRAMGVSNDEGLEEVFDMISTFPARAMGLREHGLREGARADLVLFDAQSAPEVLLHQATRAMVFKNGKVVAEAGRSLW